MEDKKEEVKSEASSKLSNIGFIALVLAVILIGVGAGLLIVMPNESGFGGSDSNNSSSGNNEQSNVENTNNNVENNENNENKENNNIENNIEENTNTGNENIEIVKPNEDDLEDIDVNDSLVQQLYKKYHSEDSSTQLSGNAIESKIYSSEIFEITKINEIIPLNYAIKILDAVMDYINSNNLVDSNYQETINEKTQQAFKEFFGERLTYKKDLFKCFEYENNNNVVKYRSNCGDTSSGVANYSITKAKQDSDSIYIYEDVVIEDDIQGTKETYSYRWRYEKQTDGMYYLLYVERI